jgi:ethanolamine utilization protein EutQ (cupin superfamily)
MGPNTWGPNVIKDWTLNYDICHERSTIAMGQITWTLNVFKGWTLNYVYVMKGRRYIWVRILGRQMLSKAGH